MGVIESIFLGKSFDGEDNQGQAKFVEGKIKAVTAQGITFTIPSWDNGKFLWGPSPYARWDDTAVNDGGMGASTHHHPMVGPQTGDRCLILFPEGTAIDPWVIGWWPA